MVGEVKAYFKRMATSIYFNMIKEDIRAGRYRVVTLPKRNKRPQLELYALLKKAKNFTTFVISPKLGLCHILRKDYLEETVRALRKMNIIASRDEVAEALGAMRIMKYFDPDHTKRLVLYCIELPPEIREELLAEARPVAPNRVRR